MQIALWYLPCYFSLFESGLISHTFAYDTVPPEQTSNEGKIQKQTFYALVLVHGAL